MEVVHIELFVYGPGVEEELVGGDGEEGAGEFPDALDVKVLQVLAGQNQSGLLFPYPFEGISDIFDGSQIAQPDIQLVQSGHGVALGEQLVAEKGEHVEQQCVFYAVIGLEQPFDAEHQEAAGCNIGVPIKKFALRAPAHGAQAQKHFPQQFSGIQRMVLTVIVLVDVLHQVIEVGEDGEV